MIHPVHDHRERTSSKHNDDDDDDGDTQVRLHRRNRIFARTVTRTFRGISSRKSARAASWRWSARLISSDIQRGTRSVICYRHEWAGGGKRADNRARPAGPRSKPRCAKREVGFFRPTRIPTILLLSLSLFLLNATLTRQWTRSEIQGGWLSFDPSYPGNDSVICPFECLRKSVTRLSDIALRLIILVIIFQIYSNFVYFFLSAFLDNCTI